jgi:hypothetical protein
LLGLTHRWWHIGLLVRDGWHVWVWVVRVGGMLLVW